MGIKKSYKGVLEIFARYWRCYGGFSALFLSPYLHVSLVLTVVLTPVWTDIGWWNIPIEVMPGILGFSLGGYAIWIAIGDGRFRALLAGSDEKAQSSPFMEINASFLHFILLQFLSILMALIFLSIGPSHQSQVNCIHLGFWFFGFLVFVYALLSAIAAAMAIFRVASWYDMHLTQIRESDKEK